jgi:hypothetical protein
MAAHLTIVTPTHANAGAQGCGQHGQTENDSAGKNPALGLYEWTANHRQATTEVARKTWVNKTVRSRVRDDNDNEYPNELCHVTALVA